MLESYCQSCGGWGAPMSYEVATEADTSSNQAIKDPGQWRCGYSNLCKIDYNCVAAMFVAVRTLPENSRSPISSN